MRQAIIWTNNRKMLIARFGETFDNIWIAQRQYHFH